MGRKKSLVWKFFEAVKTKDGASSKFVKCQLCKQEYCNSGNTTNLKDHLKRKHPEKLIIRDENESSDEDIQEEIPIKKSKQSIKNYINRDKMYDKNSKTKKQLDKLYVEMIATDMLPFRTSEHKGFKKFINALDNKYELPSRHTLKNTHVPTYYNEIKNKLAMAISQCKHFAITTDMWTSSSNEGILAVTCHFIQNAKLKSPLLKVTKIEGHHTAESMAQAIDEILLEYNIRHKIVAMVTDNAASMIRCADILKIRHLPCYAHSLNLTVQDCFKIDSFAGILSKCKAIVRYFRSSTLASDTLRTIQRRNNKPELKLLQEVETRWNSSYYMLRRISDVRTELAIAINECARAPTPLTAEDFEAIDEILQLLEPFEVATTTISGENYVTSSLMIPLLRGISTKITSFQNKLKTVEGLDVLNSLINSVNKRLKSYNARSTAILATVLDPKFKKNGFKTSEEADNAIQLLQREYTPFIASTHQAQATTSSGASSSSVNVMPSAPQACTEGNSKADDLLFLPNNNQPQRPIATPMSDAIIDIRQYIEKPVIERQACSLDYWSTSNSMLREMADKYLCVPATSVPSERIFSKAGDIMTNKRNRLKDKYLCNNCCIVHTVYFSSETFIQIYNRIVFSYYSIIALGFVTFCTERQLILVRIYDIDY